jgi:hypothetical protein
MRRIVAVVIVILGLVGWGLALGPDLRSDDDEPPAATAVSGNASASETPGSAANPTARPTRPPNQTVPPTLALDPDSEPRPTRTPD